MIKIIITLMLISCSSFSYGWGAGDGKYICYSIEKEWDVEYKISIKNSKVTAIQDYTIYSQKFDNDTYKLVKGTWGLRHNKEYILLRSIKLVKNRFGFVVTFWRTLDIRLANFSDTPVFICEVTK